MGLIEQIKQMQNSGIPENQIIENLQEQGIPPADIQNSLNQIRVKNAVAGESGTYEQETYSPQEQIPQMPEDFQNYDENQNYPQEEYSQDPYSQEEYSQYQQMPQEYSQTNSDNTLEIAEQVVSNSLEKINPKISQLQEYKKLSESELKNLNKRLEKIEQTIDKLQMAILEKVGSYGQGIQEIKNEMEMMQESFSKSLDNQLNEHSSKTKKTSKKKSSSKKPK
jgi:hypothetical protein